MEYLLIQTPYPLVCPFSIGICSVTIVPNLQNILFKTFCSFSNFSLPTDGILSQTITDSNESLGLGCCFNISGTNSKRENYVCFHFLIQQLVNILKNIKL